MGAIECGCTVSLPDRGTSAGRLPYAGAKAGIEGFTKQLAKDLGPWGINVNAIMPGFILTEADARVARRYADLSKEEQKAMYSRVPLGRPGRPEEIAKVALYKASAKLPIKTKFIKRFS